MAAVPFAPVVAFTPPKATVAPAAGAAAVPSSCSTLTVTVAPGAAVAGTPVSRERQPSARIRRSAQSE